MVQVLENSRRKTAAEESCRDMGFVSTTRSTCIVPVFLYSNIGLVRH
jgi:hypothetical protein